MMISVDDELFACSVPDCDKLTAFRTEMEAEHNIWLCDPESGLGHYPDFSDAYDQGEASEWIEKFIFIFKGICGECEGISVPGDYLCIECRIAL